jgi:hypothetical protein
LDWRPGTTRGILVVVWVVKVRDVVRGSVDVRRGRILRVVVGIVGCEFVRV